MSEGKAYVGSKISLISKSEIRYEGILYTIDPKEATVALAKVRSFGTEDRFTDKPIASRDDVYEYVIFRGRDIKDIKVCEPPQPQALIGGLPNDPAIVEAYQSQESRKQSFSPTGSLQSNDYGVTFSGGLLPGQSYSSRSGSRSATPTQKRRSPTIDQGTQVSGNIGDNKRDTRRSNQTQQQNQRPLQPSNQQRQPQLGGQQNRQQQPNRGWIRRGRGPRGGGGGGRGAYNKPKEQLKFDGEYDFEQANAEFIEMENKFAKAKISASLDSDSVQNGTTTEEKEKKEEQPAGTEPVWPTPTAAPVPVPAPAPAEEDPQNTFYDKTKSFFDSISCEALERSKGKFQRTDWRQERKLNVETFGVTNSYMRRGGFRGRGFRGRGGYRGGRSRGRGGMNQSTGNPNRGIENRSNPQQNTRKQGWGTQEA